MINLLIYIGPTKGFSPEHEVLTRIQIDNSLQLGWFPKEIIIATDFEWEYRRIKTHVLPERNYRSSDGNRSSKIPVINQLFRDGLINDTFWFHDHDAFQLEKEFPRGSLLSENAVAAFTDHGWSKKWNAGSFFFNSGAKDMFQKIYDAMIERGTNEQDSLTYLWENGLTGYKKLNITYNLGINQIEKNLKWAGMPLLVAHFHPRKPKHLNLFRKLVPDRLLKIFTRHGIQ